MSNGRGKNLTIPELRQVCYSFLAISQDHVTGANQRNETFWNKVTVRREQELLKLKKQLVAEAQAKAATPSEATLQRQVPSVEPAQVPDGDCIVVDGSPDAEQSGDDDMSQQDVESDEEDY